MYRLQKMGSQTRSVKGKLELIKRNNEINESYKKNDNNNCNNNGINNGNIHIGDIRNLFVQLMEAVCHFVFFHYICAVYNRSIMFHIDLVKM